MIPAECRARAAHAVMIDPHAVPVNRGKYPLAGAGGHRADRCKTGCTPSPLPVFEKNAPFLHQPVYPVLGGAPGYPGRFLDIRDRKKTAFERELPHEPQVGAPVFKHAGHNGPGYREDRR